MNFNAVLRATTALLLAVPPPASAQDWYRHSDDGHQHSEPSSQRYPDVKPMFGATHTQPVYMLIGNIQEAEMKDKPDVARHFEHFQRVRTRWDSDMLYVESNGLPDHNMMVGIRTWQQQVPLPQPYTGDNAWQIPLKPRLADKPVSAKNNLYRGAIALAVDGVPIFNALNNRGEDAFLAGELDNWGGHCGRGDDYHYHIAPVHLEDIVGKGQPIAYALDGFPIYGLTEADGLPLGKLDEFNGHFDQQGRYHYHATKKYPYLNGGMRGVVAIRGGQIEPQPRDAPIRPALRPLRGATITAFETTGKQSTLTYRIEDRTGTITFSPDGTDTWKFTYTEPNGRSRIETYQRRPRRGDRGDGRRPPPPPRGNPPPSRRR